MNQTSKCDDLQLPLCFINEYARLRFSEPYVIFSGGMPYDKASRTPSLTVMHAKNTTVLEMEHNIVDFLTLCSTPWNNGTKQLIIHAGIFYESLDLLINVA